MIRSAVKKPTLVLTLVVLMLIPQIIFAGTGKFKNGKFDFCVYVNIDYATEAEKNADFDRIKVAFEQASQLLADATDGQHRFGDINVVFKTKTLTTSSQAAKAAEFWIIPDTDPTLIVDGKKSAANAPVGEYGTKLGSHAKISIDRIRENDVPSPAGTIVHEFGHLAYNLYDEYQGPKDAQGKHPHTECHPRSIGPLQEQYNYCIMDSQNKFEYTIWFDDALPAGAVVPAIDSDAWNWISANPPPFNGTLAHQSSNQPGLHRHRFGGATQTLTLNQGDSIFFAVYLDPANPPEDIMLEFEADGSWEHRAYQGKPNPPELSTFGTPQTDSKRYFGVLGSPKEWLLISYPASAFGLEGKTITGMSFIAIGGRATWDLVGKKFSNGIYPLSEFCVEANHDKPNSLGQGGNDTEQQAVHHHSCWKTMSALSGIKSKTWKTSLINGLPQDAPPSSPPPTVTRSNGCGTLKAMILIDTSGSVQGGSLQSAKRGVNQFIDLFLDGGDLGIASFNDLGLVNYPLTAMSSTEAQEAAKTAVNSITGSGGTDIGAGLQVALKELTQQTQDCSSCEKNIFLLSDGYGDITPSVISALKAADIKVTTLAIGSDVNDSLMQNIAKQTGGTYINSPKFPSPNGAALLRGKTGSSKARKAGDDTVSNSVNRSDLTNAVLSDPQIVSTFLDLVNEYTGTDLVKQEQSSIATGEIKQFPAYLEADVESALFTVSHADSADNVIISLETPSGTTITEADAAADPNLKLVTGPNSRALKVLTPEAGTWKLIVTAGTVTNGKIETRVFAEHPGVRLNISVANENVLYSDSVEIHAVPMFEGENVIEASVTGIVIRRDGSKVPITLFDDGQLDVNGDEESHDGIYSARFNNYNGLAGGYIFQLTAENINGKIPPGESLFSDTIWTAAPAFTRAGNFTVTVVNSHHPYLQMDSVTSISLGGDGDEYIEPGEGGLLNVQLSNPELSTATNITATLTTSTPGVTITTAASAYPDIDPLSTDTNNPPFAFSLADNVPNGMELNFTLNVSTPFGTSQSFPFVVQTGQSILIASGDDPATITTNTAGQNALFSFNGTAGSHALIKLINNTISQSSNVSVIKPDGEQLIGIDIFQNQNRFIDIPILPLTGAYQIIVSPSGANIGSIAAQLNSISGDITTVVPDQPLTTVVTTNAGQNPTFSFDGTVGQKVFIDLNKNTIPGNSNVALIAPDGATLNFVYIYQNEHRYIDTQTLPVNGTYKIVVDPYNPTAIGNITMQLSNVTDTTTTIALGGEPVTIATTTPGQNAVVTFTGTAGQKVFTYISSHSFPTFVSILLRKPDGTGLAGIGVYPNNTGFIDTQTLPVTGTYSIFIDPYGIGTGDMTLRLYDVSDLSTTIVPNAAPITINTSVPGQNALLTFGGTANQHVKINLSNNTFPGTTNVLLLKPDGSQLASRALNQNTTGSIEVLSLPVAGTYTIHVDPSGASIGSIKVQLSNITDTTGIITPNGLPATVTTAVPGQSMQLTFNGTAGRRMAINFFDNTFPGSTYVSLLNPSGSQIDSRYLTQNSAGVIDLSSLPLTGTYSIVIRPASASAGSITVLLTDFDQPRSQGAGKLVYSSFDANRGKKQIFSINADGTGKINISNSSVDDDYPFISPDGNRIAFARNGLSVMNADGGNQIRLTNAYIWYVDVPSWSPDGSKIVFKDWNSTPDLFIINADGSGRTQITSSSAHEDWMSWSPDGSKIAFVRGNNVYTINPTGTNETLLWVGSYQASYLVWSPNGQSLAWTGGYNNQLVVVNADGSNLRTLTLPVQTTAGLSWSQDSTKIAYSGSHYTTEWGDDVFVVPASGGTPTRITFLTHDGTSRIKNIAWSPDGTQIAYSYTVQANASSEIYVVNTDRGNWGKISQEAMDNVRVIWSPSLNFASTINVTVSTDNISFLSGSKKLMGREE